jgi:hypothetical protein
MALPVHCKLYALRGAYLIHRRLLAGAWHVIYSVIFRRHASAPIGISAHPR